MADERLSLKAADVGRALAYVAGRIFDSGKASGKLTGSSEANTADEITAVRKAAHALNPGEGYWGKQGMALLNALADDLLDAKGKGTVMVGPRQPAAVHGLAHFVNAMLGSLAPGGLSQLLLSRERFGPRTAGPVELAEGLGAGKFDTVICIGTNPAYDTAGSLGLAEKLAKVKTLVHVGSHRDETAQLATWHIPLSHELESWGDLQTLDGVTSIVQPMIEPLHESVSALDFVGRLVDNKTKPADRKSVV